MTDPPTMLLTDIAHPLEPADVRPRTQSEPMPAAPATVQHSLSLAQELVITAATWRDWDSICHMVARNFPLENEINMGYWLCHQLPYFRVARYRGDTIGFLHAQPFHDTGTLWVNMLAVDERYRQQGVAHRLVEHFDSVCRDWGCHRIGLQCLNTNTAALALYERQGFAVTEESRSELGLPVVRHLKTLPVHDAPRSCPRPPVALDAKPLRLAYRLLYLAWYRRRSPMPRLR